MVLKRISISAVLSHPKTIKQFEKAIKQVITIWSRWSSKKQRAEPDGHKKIINRNYIINSKHVYNPMFSLGSPFFAAEGCIVIGRPMSPVEPIASNCTLFITARGYSKLKDSINGAWSTGFFTSAVLPLPFQLCFVYATAFIRHL